MATCRLPAVVALLGAFVACGDDPKPDTAPPEVVIEAPASRSRVSDPVTVNGTVDDPKIKGRKTSGVTSVVVDDVAATVAGGRFEAILTALSPGPRTISVVATDKAGNATTATVEVDVGPPITQLHVEPPVVALASTTKTVPLVVMGFFEGSGASNVTNEVTYTSADPSIAVVDPSGLVNAASRDARGTTTITVRLGDLSASVEVSVQIDVDPPSRPNVVGYFPSANQRDQTWTGITEPEATLVVSGAAEPVSTKADRSGRFWLNVPLVANRYNDLVLTLSDSNGNAATFPFPVTQSDGAIDAGTLHFSSTRQVVGFVGELVPEQLAARAYTPAGAPLAGALVTFSVMTGEGTVGDGVSEGRSYTTTTDAAGYAKARWRLGESDYGRVEVHAALAGDTGFPVVFMAEGFMRLQQPTEVEGVVYDDNRVPVVGLPVTILAPGSEYASTTTGSAGVTDERGHFRIAYAPAIAEPRAPLFQHMRLDGTAMAPQKYVRIDRQVTVLPGQINDVGTFWIPRLPEGVVPKLDANGVVTEAFTLEREILPNNGPVRVHVAVGTKITWPGGVPEDARRLTLLTIPGNRAPMSLPDGFFSPEVLALQPGGTRFDPPLRLDLPNTNGAAPGQALTMWSYDHFQSEYVPIGRGIVSADGSRVVSEDGSGIRVGAWHQVSPPVPDPPCTAQGQTKVTTIKGKPPKERKPDKCKCYIEGTEQPTPCPEDADMDGTPDKFIVTNIPGCKAPPPPPPNNPPPNNPPPPKPPARKVEVVCEEQALQITSPTEIISYVKRGETMQFTAECLDNHKSDGNIQWQRSAPVPAGATPNPPKSGSGPRFTIRFDQEGRYVVSASANTKTCKGNDQRTVVVKTCVDMGVTRTCGDKIEQVGPTSDNRWKVSGNVRMGLKGSGSEPGSTTPNTGDLYLQIGGDMLVDALVAKPLAATTVHMEVGYPIVGTKLTPIIYQSEFTVDPTGLVKIQPFAGGSNEGVAFRLMQFALQFSEFQMLMKGIFLKNPKLELFGRKDKRTIWVCNKPKDLAYQFMDYTEYKPGQCKFNEVESKEVVESKDLQIVVSGVEVNADSIIPNGYFEYKPKDAAGNPGLDLGSEAFQLTALKVGYEKNRFIGELGLQMNLKRMSLGIKTSLTIGEGYFSGELGVSFAGFQLGAFTVPGIPIVPVLFGAPVYLSSLGLGYESTSWPVSDTAAMKLTGKAGVTLGPTLDLLSKKVALATGALTMTMSPYPLAFGMKGELSLLSVTGGSFDSATTETPMKLTGAFDVAFEPVFMVKLSGESSMYVPDLFGATVTDPFYKGTIAGQVSVLPEDGSVRGQMSGGVSWQIPKTKFTPTINVLSGTFVAIFLTRNHTMEASGSVSFNCLTYTCTMSMLHDPVNGLSVWMQTDKGDFVNLYGLNPNLRARQVAAPSLGVSAETAVAKPYDGNPLSFELLEPAARMIVTLDKARGPVAGVLMLPNGERVAPVANPQAFANEVGVDFDEGADGKTASWTVYGAEPGTYTYLGPNDGDVIAGVYAFVPAPLPQLVFDEPFMSEGDTTLTWTASGGSADATLTLLAVPVDPVSGALEGWTSLTRVPLASGAFEVDAALLPYGEYRIVAEMASQGGKVYAETIGTYTLGEAPEPAAAAPRYVRAVPADDALTVTWLPGEAAASRYVVSAFDAAGEVVAKQAVVAPGNRVVFEDSTAIAKVMVDAQGTDSVTTTIVVPREVAGVVAPTRARVGTTWRFGVANAVVERGPAGIVVGPDAVTWTPSAADIGTHDLVVRTAAGAQSFVLQVLAADRSAAPDSVRGPEGRVVDGVVGAPVRFLPEVYSFDPADVVIVSAPEGATLEAGEVRWTPSAAEATAGRGLVPIVVRATSGGLATDIKWLVRFADSDGDGLDDAWERASGLDPFDADSGDGDGDDDGVVDRDELAAGTLAYVADSDGDGIDDGDDAAPALGDGDGDGLGDGDEVGRGTDPARADSDGDGIDDGAEVAAGTDPKANADVDGDGLSDDREALAGTNATVADTDGDGLTDREEVDGYRQGGEPCWGPTNPLAADSDGDLADDGSEAKRCDGVTNPNNNGVDVDGDGLRSDYERILGTLDGRADTDGDGVDDAIELAVGTDPTEASSAPEGVETQADEPIANVGESQGLVLAPEALTDFGVIEVFPDADHDSANDAYEVQWDYDPESPADAYDDADGDLLPMWLESRLGTNPRAKDSDGDGVDDGVELQDGTDPNDPASVSSSGPVAGITSYPRQADLQAHAFLGPLTLQLSVVGTRADGSSVDLSATGRGTSYVVDPIAAGTVDASGQFAMSPGFVGEAVVHVSNLALTTETTIGISTFTPGPVSSLALPGAPTAIALGVDAVYVGGPWGLQVVDTATIETPMAVGTVSLPASPVAFAADGSWVAAALGSAGVAIVDLSDPAAPRLLAHVPTAKANGVAWAGGYALAATDAGLVRIAGTAGIGLVDGDGDGQDDRILDVQAVGGAFNDVARDLDRIVAARADGHVLSYRTVSGGLIQELDLAAASTASDIALTGSLLVGATGTTGSRMVLGTNARWTASAALGRVLYAAQARDFVLVTESTSGTVVFLDARGAAPLTTLGSVDYDAFFPGGLVADERYFYLADGAGMLRIGAHGALNDTLGVPPTVVPVAPLAGRTIEEGTRLAIEVAAHDDIGVKSVTLTRDGEDVVTSELPPYVMSVKTTNVATPTAMEIGAYANDFGGNYGEMASLTFEVTPVDDRVAPTIALLEPVSDEWVAASSQVLVAVRPEDEHAIWKVEVKLDGALVATLEDPPYATEITMPASAPSGRLRLEVTAFDYGENTARAEAALVFAGVDLVANGVTSIGADDGTYDGQDVLIRRGTVAIDGPHTFGKVRIGRDGVLTHGDVSAADDGFGVDIACERLDVMPTGAIDVTGRGYLGDCAPGNACGGGPRGEGNQPVARIAFGGGSHGGVGGVGSRGTYGDWLAPATHGGGGNYGSGGGEPGGDGGGRIHIVAEAMVLDGVVRANGGNGVESAQRNGGGGAGGSVSLELGELSGVGRIEANGGTAAGGTNSPGSPGGGGRVALVVDVVDFDLAYVRALPGSTAVAPKAGPGTVYLDVAGVARLVIDDANRSAGVDNLPLAFAPSATPIVVPELFVRGSSRLVLPAPLESPALHLEDTARLSSLETSPSAVYGLDLEVDRVVIGADAAIDLIGRGYNGDCAPGANCGAGPYGPGNVVAGRVAFAGGAHGGSSGPGGHGTYGSWVAPVDVGMGGNYGSGGGEPGGDGRGKARIRCGALVVDGRISADGAGAPESAQKNGSGGAGGSLWITATSIGGDGVISADGGAPASNTTNPGGAGAGGRIAIFAQTSSLDEGRIHAYPAVGAVGRMAGAGSVWYGIGGGRGRLVIDDDDRSGFLDNRVVGQVFGDAVTVLEDVIVRGSSRLVPVTPISAKAIVLDEHARLSHADTTITIEPGLTLTADSLTIGPDAMLDVLGRGYLGDCAGADPCGDGGNTIGNVGGGARQRSGGSHGGLGGGLSPNPTYGDPVAPNTLGAGGGYGNGGGEPGGDGGGRVRLILGELVVHGAIRADGGDAVASANLNGSGGAGGSLWITTDTLRGEGVISANGGTVIAERTPPGANGGGGRIAIAYGGGGFDEARIRAWPGGPNGQAAAAGTVYFIGAPGQDGRLVLDDGGLGGVDGRALSFEPSNEPQTLAYDLVLRGTSRLALARPLIVKDLVLEGSAVLTHLMTTPTYEGGLDITAESITIAAGAAIDVSGRGYIGDCAAGDTSCGNGPNTFGNVPAGHRARAGGSHGGIGAGALPHLPFGDPFAPTTLGGGGSYGAGGGEPGGNGGGRVRIVADRVSVAGRIDADGEDALPLAQRNGSGGAGGSIYITAGVIDGSGVITSRGGEGGDNAADLGSGGGGGRIALSYTTLAVPLANIDARGGGASAASQGGPGTLRLDGASDRLIVDGRGRVNQTETAPWSEVGANVVSAVNADGVSVAGNPWLAGALVGRDVVIGGRTVALVSNTTNALVVSGSLSGITVGAEIRGTFDARGALEILNGARVALTDTATAQSLLVDGAVLTHPAMTVGGPPVGLPGLSLIIAGTATVSTDGSIDVTGRGYGGDCGAGDVGCGDGATTYLSAAGARQFAGGSHGGMGGGAASYVFGDPLAPDTLGGGGGYGAGGGEPGGRGGGRVKLSAGALVLDGVINARGLPGVATAQANGSGGAGGSVWIVVDTLGGAGTIDAGGGDAGGGVGGSGGGGGRVAVIWGDDAADAFDLTAIASHGGDAEPRVGGPGTIYLGEAGGERLVVDNGGVANTSEIAPWVEVGIRTVTAAGSDRVTVSNAGWLPNALVGHDVVFGAGANRYTVVSNTIDSLVFQASEGSVAGMGGMLMRGVYPFAGTVELRGGARVALLDRVAAEAFDIHDGAVLTHAATVIGQPEQGLWLEVSGVLTVAADGAIDASWRGYRGDCSAGSGGCVGGAVWFGNVTGGAGQNAGGSFGGLGGGLSNAVYGDSVAAWLLGAGGGYGNGSGEPGGAGGGRVRLIVGSLVLLGDVRVDGQGGGGLNAGGGAGGGVFITATQLSGGGRVSARGGDGIGNGGGGGGGRVHIDAPGNAGTIVVEGGASDDPTRGGAPGTSVRD